MKVYRKSIFRLLGVRFCIFSYALPFVIYSIKQAEGYAGYIYSFSMGTFALLSISFYSGYLILDKENMTIKNSFYPFWNKSFLYKEIDKIQFYRDAGMARGPYFRIFVNNRSSRRYFLESVRENDFYEIVAELQKKGVNM